MIIECKKRVEGYKPVKGNELEIIKHLLDHNFYNSYSIKGSRIEVEGRICRTISFEIEENWGSTSFDNEEGVFFKCEKNGQIKIRYGEPKPKKCIGVIFDVFNVDVIEILQAKNFKGLRRDSPFSKGYEWELKTETDTFKVNCGDLAVIDDDEGILDCLRHVDDAIENGYAVHGNSINQEIYTLEKRLQKSRNLEEKRCIIERILSLKNSKNREG